MFNPSQLLQTVKAMDFGGDLLRAGRATGIGKILSGIGRRTPSGERAAAITAAARGIDSPVGRAARAIESRGGAMGMARGAAVGISTAGADVAARAGVLGREAGIYGRVAASTAWQTLSGSRAAQRALVVGGAAGVGLATSSPDSSPMQKVGRMVGFGVMGNYGMRTLTNPGSVNSLKGAMRGLATGRYKAAGRLMARGLGMPAQWGMKQSVMAGALYGMVSDRSSVAEGAAFGAAAHFGVKGMANTWTGATNRSIYRAYRKNGLLAAVNKMPLAGAGMYLGAMKGAYGNLGEGNWSGLNVVGGAAGGAAIGGAVGATAKLVSNHPWMTLGTVGPTLGLAGSAAEAAGTVAQAGAPGFDSMNADGDLALALHKMRHG